MKVKVHGMVVEDYRRQTDSYKFDSGLAEYAYYLSMDTSFVDDFAGDIDFGFANRMGKHILWGATRGFVWIERYATEELAKDAFDVFSAELGLFRGDDDDE